MDLRVADDDVGGVLDGVGDQPADRHCRHLDGLLSGIGPPPGAGGGMGVRAERGHRPALFGFLTGR
ncbi:hypothetical protein GCM10010359_28440 [Streptomyces morookaense]|nr:hypothetical protein GCM10010359_28440 [Streptomyces morookaense]